MMSAMIRKRFVVLALAVLACSAWRPGVSLAQPASAEPTAPAPADADADTGHNHPPDMMQMMSDGGSIAIEVVQGTSGGRPVTGGEVTVHLAGPGQHKTLKMELDEYGVVLLEGLSLAARSEPRVTFVRDGISFDASGETVGPDRTHQKITVTVYEITDQEPEWSISMQHLLAWPIPGGMYFQQMMVVVNPSDRAWLGLAGDDGIRGSFSLDLPEGYQDLQMSGDFHDCCSSQIEGRLTSHKPMMPGSRRYRVHYIVPAKDNQVDIELVAPGPVGSMILFVPYQYLGVRTKDLAQQETLYNVHEDTMTGYVAKGIPAGKRLALTFIDLPNAQDHAGHKVEGGSTNLPKILAASVGGIMLIVCVVILVIKPAKKANADPAD